MTNETRRGSSRSLLRHRGARWLLGLLLVVALFEGWSNWPSESFVSRANRVKLGQSKAEVAQVMGTPRMTYQNGTVDHEFFGPKTRAQLEVQAFLSRNASSLLFAEEQFPVGIEYGTDSRVQRIRVVPGAW